MYIYENRELKFDVTMLATVPAFQVIWNRDRTVEKKVAKAQLGLIFHLHNVRSPYSTCDSGTRMTLIIRDLYEATLKEWKEKVSEDTSFKKAADQYLYFLDLVPERVLLTAAQDAVHDLATKISDKETKNKENLLRSMKSTLDDLKGVREMVYEAEEHIKNIKGNRNIKRREDPAYLDL